jgi:tripartite-type tricarboxylate transporter receptor subunit TctC
MKAKRSNVLTALCFLVISLFSILSFLPSDAAAAGYPDKAITLIVPFSAGGSVDLSARILAEAMEKEIKQPVVVVNKPGGAMTVGGYAVVSAKPDGYTLGYLAASGGIPEVFKFFYSAPYSSKDFRPICPVNIIVITIAVKQDAPWNTLKELTDFARKNPGMKYGHNGRNMLQYVAMTTIAKTEKVTFIDVPYRGDRKQVPALLGGHIPIATLTSSSIRPLWEAKKIKPLALITGKGAEMFPGIPTISELGYDVPAAAFTGLFAPKETPDEVVKKIYEVVDKIRNQEEFQKKCSKLDLQIAHEDPASFEKSMMQIKERLQAFFKEEGMVK